VEDVAGARAYYLKDQTLVTRLERVVAALEVVTGRLERLSENLLPPTALGPTASSPPQDFHLLDSWSESDKEAQELAEKVIRNQLEAQKERAEAG